MATIVEDDRALLSGSSWWSSGTFGKSAFITYSFESESYEQVAGPSHSNAFRASFKPFTEAEKAAARDAMKQWCDASGIRFLEADPGRGDIRLATYDLGKDPTGSKAAGYAYYRSVDLSAGNGAISDIGGDVYIDDQVAGYRSGDMAHVFVHEIGLKHSFEGDVILDSDLDDTDHTVMSYSGDGPKLGPIDIAAIRHLYGGPASDGSHVAAWSWDAATDTLTQIGGNGADTIRGVASADVMRGAGGDDRLSGGAGNDTFLIDAARDRVVEARGGRDTVLAAVSSTLDAGQEVEVLQFDASAETARLSLRGNAFAQTLIGNSNANRLDGALGNDLLKGGKGADTFVFSTTPFTGNCDRIADFASEDTIRLSKSIFADLTAGGPAETAFRNISAGTIDADDRILYRKTTGDLFYDPDGAGKLGAVKLAVLDNKAVLTAADFLVA
jgi:Ca2+-binding RTX toxin-like protein